MTEPARRIDPVRLARLLGLPEPTDEQATVIAGPLEPTVVVAGAGSGKSETMAARVVWLVANGLVHPDRVLGLTFTRKAAGELAERVRTRLGALAASGWLGEAADELELEPTVATYHSYAMRLVADHALREALEPSMRLITPAIEWQLASRVVAGYDGPMDKVAWSPPTVTAAVLELTRELAEHLRECDDVRRSGEWLRGRAAALRRVPAEVRRILDCQDAREQLLPLVERYRAARSSREVMDHGDLLAHAARIAERHPQVGAIERSRFGVVLLDEYQDTSHAQLVLLRSLYGAASGTLGHPVTAVGDPCQSIYGWRGASSGTLAAFRREFTTKAGGPARLVSLSTSFRNGERVLAAAGTIGAPLRADAPDIPVLASGPGRQRRGRVVCGLFATAADEAAWVGEEVAALLAAPPGAAPDGAPWPEPDEGRRRLRPSDVAVLCRKRTQFAAIRGALEERGIPVEVVGLGGLLTVPEVADIVATLRVMHDPGAGDGVVRLLSGPRWRLGPRDLVALGRRARELAAEEGAEPEDADPLRQAVADLSAEAGSLVDALDDPGEPDRYSPVGYQRLTALGAELRRLRGQVGQPLPDLVTVVERALGLDVEVAARPGADPVAARADLDAFADATVTFARDAEEPTLGAFLAYLAAAADQEFGLEAGRVGDTDTVKLMTVHAAKGLQWPVVVVPGLSAGGRAQVFPARPRTSTKWTDNPRKLPFPLRGDAGDLPALPALDADARSAFADACAERDQREERRLAYVAVTRAAYCLLTSGYWWGEGRARLGPSVFCEELAAVCRAYADDPGFEITHWEPPPEPEAINPLLAEPASVPWPSPRPAASRAPATAEGAELVRAAIDGTVEQVEQWLAGTAGPDLDEADRSRLAGWEIDERLLLAEHRDVQAGQDGAAQHTQVELPARLSVSSLVALARDPEELARAIRRPMPAKPAPQLRRGTAFHRWLEGRFGQQRLLDIDEMPGAADDPDATDAGLDELRARFEASEWAARTPIDTEVPFETVIADRLIRGRIDAVFADGDGYRVIDWKTGRPPSAAEEERAVAVQLAAYRLGWSRLAGVPLESVGAAFHYVPADRTFAPVDLLDERGLTELVMAVPEG